MTWKVVFHEEFVEEFRNLEESVQDALLTKVELLVEYGPRLKRPHADTLKGSKYANMKELRFTDGKGVWRAAYAFDPERRAVILAAAMKQGRNQKRFYQRLIVLAEERFARYLGKR